MGSSWQKQLGAISALVCAAMTAGCTRDYKFQAVSMWNESRLKPMEASTIGGRLSSARAPVIGTVARGQRSGHDSVLSARIEGKLVKESPVPVTAALLERGQERYNLGCAPCHGRLGNGAGMIVKRGFPHPPDYAIKRLREAPVGHFFDVMSNGYGVMYSQAERISVQDRWAIASYIRVLQKTRPEVPDNVWEFELIRARERGILDPVRGLRTPDPSDTSHGAAAPSAGAAEHGGAAPSGGAAH